MLTAGTVENPSRGPSRPRSHANDRGSDRHDRQETPADDRGVPLDTQGNLYPYDDIGDEDGKPMTDRPLDPPRRLTPEEIPPGAFYDTTDELWTITECAKACGVSPRTIRRRLDTGDLPNARREWTPEGPETSVWLIPPHDLEALGFRVDYLALRTPR
jgi:hypothetical protein